MSDHLVYLARTSRFGERNASRKLAMIALCNAASDKGQAVVMPAEEIAEAAELKSVKNAMRLRRELVALGLLELVEDGADPLPGCGRGAKGEYRINVARLEALHEGLWDYEATATEWRSRKGGAMPPNDEPERVPSQHPNADGLEERVLSRHPIRVARHHPNRVPKKGASLGAVKGAAKGAALGAAASTSSIKESTNYWIDDVDDLALPDWAIEDVKQIEPERWPVLAEAFLRWDGARKAVDIGKAFVGWTKSILQISKPGKGRIATRADWAKIYAMAGLTAEQVREGVPLPSAERLAQRSNGDWRLRLLPRPAEASA